MSPVRIGVLGPSEIASRRFIPAILASNEFEYVGVACASAAEWSDKPLSNTSVLDNEHVKAENIREKFGGTVFDSYHELLTSVNADAIYIPLPPGLHFRWGREALLCGKHILLEKPFTAALGDTRALLELADKNGLAVHEDFAFIYHRQISEIDRLIANGTIGEIRLIRATFSFPYRGNNDFRYNKALGGGALLDCGGYPLKLATHLLGEEAMLVTSSLSSSRAHDVDVFGSATLKNSAGTVAQISFGMDNVYRCMVEIHGSEGMITTSRVFSPPPDMKVKLTISGQSEQTIELDADDQFLHSAEHFALCIRNSAERAKNSVIIEKQAFLTDEIRRCSL